MKKNESKISARKRSKSTGSAQKSLSSTMPVYKCLAAESMFETGLGSVWISRKLPNGKLAVGMFLLDVFCLGVKNAMFQRMSRREYEMMMMNFAESMRPIKACCLKKLVLEAVAYAENLGFKPHKDYATAIAALEGSGLRSQVSLRTGRQGGCYKHHADAAAG